MVMTAEERRARRKERLEALRTARKSDVAIAYVTSTRPGYGYPLTSESFRWIYEHMPPERVSRIDLFLHSDGGDAVVPWRLMSLLREYSEDVDVLIPYRAFSAATSIALGARSIVMHPMGILGPIDPRISDAFSPLSPDTGQRVGVNVEDVSAYMALVKEDAGITHEDEVIQAFIRLAEQVHPLTLGHVKRGTGQARMLTEKLLRLRDPAAQQHHIDTLIESLTSKLYYHGHPISRREAKDDLDLHVEFPPTDVEQAMWNLYEAYEDDLQLVRDFEPAAAAIEKDPQAKIEKGEWTRIALDTMTLAVIESDSRADILEEDLRVSLTETEEGELQALAVPLRRAWNVYA